MKSISFKLLKFKIVILSVGVHIFVSLKSSVHHFLAHKLILWLWFSQMRLELIRRVIIILILCFSLTSPVCALKSLKSLKWKFGWKMGHNLG